MSKLLLVATVTLALTGCKGQGGGPPSTSQLPFKDDFDRAELGPNYTLTGGRWMLKDGQVYSTGANNQPLFLNVDLPADVVVEVDATSDTAEVDTKIELMTNGRTHSSGYIFILGGWHNALSAIARLDEHGQDRKTRQPTGVLPRVWYHWRIEKKGGDIRWLIDGKPYLDFHDPEPLQGPGHSRLSFSNWQNEIHYDHLAIWPYASAPPVKTSTGGATP